MSYLFLERILQAISSTSSVVENAPSLAFPIFVVSMSYIDDGINADNIINKQLSMVVLRF